LYPLRLTELFTVGGEVQNRELQVEESNNL
jgi:hypothetical protein